MVQRIISLALPILFPKQKLALKMPMREKQDKIQFLEETIFSAAEVQTPCFMAPKIISVPVAPIVLPLS